MRKVLPLLILLCFAASAGYSQMLGCSTLERNVRTKENLRIKAIDTTKDRGLADNYYLWNNGETIKVKFLSGSTALQNKIKTIAKQWETYANVKFDFVASGPASIRVLLNKDNGHWSYLGTFCQAIPQDQQTLTLDTTDLTNPAALNGTVLHEFGHALGLLHEHFSPVSGIQWNKEMIYKEYWRTQRWTREEVDFQVFRSYDESYTNGTAYDNKSIMHYPISSWETRNGYKVPWNHYLSAGDKELIAALYPKKGNRTNEVPRVSITKFTKLHIEKNDKKGGLSLFPSFDLTSAGKSGKLVLLTEFFDANGYPLADTDGQYRFGEQVSAMRSVFVLPGKKLSYNKGTSKDFEIFIPYNQIELPEGQTNVYLRFRAVLETDSGELKDLYSGNALSYSITR